MVREQSNEDAFENSFDEDDEDTQKDKYLTFLLDKEEYGVDIRFVTEVVGLQEITSIPDMPEFIKGVINLRGKVIPVMDVRMRFKMEKRDYDDRTCVVVVDIDDTSVGLVVDEVQEVTDIPESRIEPPPKVSKSSRRKFIMGLGKLQDRVTILLDVRNLLYDEELEQLSDLA